MSSRLVPEPSAERFLAPILVFGLHILLVFDVAFHRPALRDFRKPLALGEWSLVVAASCAYLRVVLSSPGYLGSKPEKPARVALVCLAFVLALYRLLRTVCNGLAAALAAVSRALPSKRASTVSAVPGARNAPSRDVRDASARELQPIGRVALDAVGDSESFCDPGEETIQVADLEAGVQPGDFGGTAAASSGQTPESIAGTVGNTSYSSSSTAAPPPKQRRIPTSLQDGGVDPDDCRRVVLQSGHRLRFCRVCASHQPLRTKHCRDCGLCVRTHDHHCPWIGTCVGEGNRIYFYWFLVAQVAELATFLGEGAAALWFAPGWGLKYWLGEAMLLCIGLIVITLLLGMVSCLLAFHSYLAMTNLTTWESISWYNISYLRSVSPEEGSPFSRSIYENLAVYCVPWWCLPLPCPGCDDESELLPKRTEDDWLIWELGEPHHALQVDCSRCGGNEQCSLCACFEG